MREERTTALRLLNDLPRRPWLRGRATIEVAAWDDPLAGTPMDATRTPQASVIEYNARPSACDLTIVILWGRLGTLLPSEVRKPNGERYRSGTEWELDEARRAKRPLWIYRRKRLALDPEDAAFKDNLQQHAALKQFLGTLRAEDGSILGGMTEYDEVSDFSRMLEGHLEAELRRRLDLDHEVHAEVDERFRVLLADAADDLRSWRRRLKSQLNALPTVKVLDDMPPPDERESHAVAAREAAKYADLCVHLLGTSPGAAILGTDAGDGGTFPMEQLRACLEEGRSQLILHPAGFRTESIVSVPYRELVTQAHQRQDDRVRLEIVSTTMVEAQERVLQKRLSILEERERAAQARAKQRASGAARTAFVDAHELDRDSARPLVDFLTGRITILPDEVGQRGGAKQDLFEETVSRAQYLIVVFGEVASQWVLGRLEDAVKIAVEHEHRLKFGIYLRPGAPRLPPAFQPPRYSTLIDNAAGFDRAPIDRFLGDTP